MTTAAMIIHDSKEKDITYSNDDMSAAIGDFRESNDMSDAEGFGSEVTSSCPSPIASLFDDDTKEAEEDFWA